MAVTYAVDLHIMPFHSPGPHGVRLTADELLPKSLARVRRPWKDRKKFSRRFSKKRRKRDDEAGHLYPGGLCAFGPAQWPV